MSDSLHINRSEAVLELKLNRPDRRNAIAPDTARQLAAVLQDAHLDPAVRAVLITGEGRDFCTGADVAGSDQAGKMAPLDFRWATRDFYAMNRALWEIEKPVVSAVNGTVAGAGWTLALLADMVVAARDARWTHVFLRRAMVPHAGDTFFFTLGRRALADFFSKSGNLRALQEAVQWHLHPKCAADSRDDLCRQQRVSA